MYNDPIKDLLPPDSKQVQPDFELKTFPRAANQTHKTVSLPEYQIGIIWVKHLRHSKMASGRFEVLFKGLFLSTNFVYYCILRGCTGMFMLNAKIG